MRTSHAAALLIAILLAGCGGDASPPTTRSARPNPLRVGQGGKHLRERTRVAGELERQIQQQLALGDSAEASVTTCRSYRGQYGTAADASRRYGQRIARQLHTLCPGYFSSP
jgi:hypothetical protein